MKVREMLKKIKKIVESIETSEKPLIYFVISFFSAITLRNFLEIFSSGAIISSKFIHYYLSYIFLAIGIIILFHWATKEKIERVSRVVLPSFLILNLAPLLDLILSGGKGYEINYILPVSGKNILIKFLTYFGRFKGSGVTPGIRIEIGIVILGSFIYFFLKNRHIIRSLFFSFLLYSLIFLYTAILLPVKEFLNLFGLGFNPSWKLMSNFYLLLILILGTTLFYLYREKYFIEILKDVRIFRLLHFESMFILGVILGKVFFHSQLSLTTSSLFDWIFIPIAILFAWLFAVITNNLADFEIDKITNRKRPLVSGKIPPKPYKLFSLIFLLLATVYSIAVSGEILFLILLFVGNYFLYSMPPTRLKRIPILSKLLVSLNSLILVMLGCKFISGSFRLPLEIIIFFLVFFTAATNFIDLKDYKGDKKEGIYTLPTLLGLKRSKRIIGALFVLTYISAYFSFDFLKGTFVFLILLITGLIQFFLINRKNYNEKPVFVVYLTTLIFIISWIYFGL